MFIGSPWFNSLENMKEQGLMINDFALFDPIIDLLHVMMTNEIGMEDVKEMLAKYKAQQKELRKLSLIATESTNMVVVTNSSGEIEWVNRAYEEKTGFKLAQIKGKRPGDFRSGPMTDPETERHMYDMLESGKPFQTELQAYNNDGSFSWVRVSGQSVFDANGRVENYFAIEENITEEKESMIRLQLSEEKYRGIIQNMELGLVELDAEGKAVSCNETFHKITGLPKESLCHRLLSDVLKEQSRKTESSVRHSDQLNDVTELYEAEILQEDGTPRWVLEIGRAHV